MRVLELEAQVGEAKTAATRFVEERRVLQLEVKGLEETVEAEGKDQCELQAEFDT